MKKNRKEKVGIVVSNKCNKSITVRVDRFLKHFFYGKFIRKSTKFIAHDEKNICEVGDFVEIMEIRPISKNKKWKVIKVIKNI